MAALTEQEAVAETARYYLDVYGAFVWGHTPKRHHQVWVREFMRLEAEGGKLLIIAPPGSAKTTWCQVGICWLAGRHPEWSQLFFTSSDTNARIYTNPIKSMLEDNEVHRLVFPAPDCRPDEKRGWSSDGMYLAGTPRLGKDPFYRALGFGASAIGSRAHVIWLDDPLTQDQNMSAVEMEKARLYHDGTVDSRLHPERPIEIAVMTSWCENDFAHFLAEKSGWRVLHMPAMGDPNTRPISDGARFYSLPEGESIWPEKFPAQMLREKQLPPPKGLGMAQFNAIWQGDPTGIGGDVFKDPAWFRDIPAEFYVTGADGRSLRDRLFIVTFADTAFSEKQTADYTAILTLGVGPGNELYVIGLVWGQWEEKGVEDRLVEQALLWRPHVFGVEDAAFRQSIVQRMVQNVRRRVMVAIKTVPSTEDKVARARLPASYAQAGMLYVDKKASWWTAFESQALGFPKTAHKDIVDALSGACRLAAEGVRFEDDVSPRRQHMTYAVGDAQPYQSDAEMSDDIREIFEQLSGQRVA